MNDSDHTYNYDYDPGGSTYRCNQDCMIIESSAKNSKRLQQVQERKPLELTGETLPNGYNCELTLVQEKVQKDPFRTLKPHWVIRHVPEKEKDKNQILEHIGTFLKRCRKPRGTLWYFGEGRKDTGDWCFRDGTFVTFDDIFELYQTYFQGKILTIITDCPHSGHWSSTCVNLMEKLVSPACGHNSRDAGIMIKVYVSCRNDQIAREAWFATHGVKCNESDGHLLFNCSSSENQTPACFDFTRICCTKDPYEKCGAHSSWTWSSAMFKRYFGCKLYVVRGKDGGREAWHYVLIPEERLGEFHKKLSSGSVDVAEFGFVLESGWGKDPPQHVSNRVHDRF